MKFVELGRATLNVSGIIPWAEVQAARKGEMLVSVSLHLSASDCGCSVNIHLDLLLPCLPSHDGRRSFEL